MNERSRAGAPRARCSYARHARGDWRRASSIGVACSAYARPGRRGRRATARSPPRPRTPTAPAGRAIRVVARGEERIRTASTQRAARGRPCRRGCSMRVAHREPRHARTSTSPVESRPDRPTSPSDRRSREATGTLNVTRAGPRTARDGARRRHAADAATAPVALELDRRDRDARAATRASRWRSGARPTVGRRLGGEHRHRERHDHVAQRRRQHPDQLADGGRPWRSRSPASAAAK